MHLLLLFLLLYVATPGIAEESIEKNDLLLPLESLKGLTNATSGERKITHCSIHLNRIGCMVNLTATTVPCSVIKIIEHLFPNIDIAKVTGGFIGSQVSLVNVQFDFTKLGDGCNPKKGTVELNANSSSRHIRIVDKKYLPLKIVLLQVTWLLGIDILRLIDLDINGVFISDNLGGSPSIPRYEGIVIEIQKPKELTIYEFKTTKLQSIQLKHLVKDFNLELENLLIGLSAKTKTELSLNNLIFAEAMLIGYIEPNIMFEFQLTGRQSGSVAYENAHKMYVTVQKYHTQFEPSIAIFGRFTINNKVETDLLKLANVPDVPYFSFLESVKDYALILATDRFSVINIKDAREASDDFSCSDCKLRYLPGLNVVFNVPDVFRFVKQFSSNMTKDTDSNSTKKNLIDIKRANQMHYDLKKKFVFPYQIVSKKWKGADRIRYLKRSSILPQNVKGSLIVQKKAQPVKSYFVNEDTPQYQYYVNEDSKKSVTSNKVTHLNNESKRNLVKESNNKNYYNYITEDNKRNFVASKKVANSYFSSNYGQQPYRGNKNLMSYNPLYKNQHLKQNSKKNIFLYNNPYHVNKKISRYYSDDVLKRSYMSTYYSPYYVSANAKRNEIPMKQYSQPYYVDERLKKYIVPHKELENVENLSHKNRKRPKRDDLRDILNSISPGNTTSNESSSDIDDMYMLEDNPEHEQQDQHLQQQQPQQQVTEPAIVNKNMSSEMINDLSHLSINENTTTSNTTSQSNATSQKDTTSRFALPASQNFPTPSTTTTTTATQPTTTKPTTVQSTMAQPTTSSPVIINTTSSMMEINVILNNSTRYNGSSQTNKAVSKLQSFTFQAKTDEIIIFASIQEKSISFAMPQNIEAGLEDINTFIMSTESNKEKCTPFKGSNVKFSIDSINILEDEVQINLNTTHAKELIPTILTIDKYMGVSIVISKSMDGKFDFQNIVYTGEGKQTILDEETLIKLVPESSSCSVVGEFQMASFENITRRFGVNLLSTELKKAFPLVGKIHSETLSFKTKLGGEKVIRLFGRARPSDKTIVDIEGQIWNSGDDGRKIVLALISHNIPLDMMLKQIYDKNKMSTHPWITMEKAAILISVGDKTEAKFEDPFLVEAPKDAGITFIGTLARAVRCENELATDKYCQYFHSKLGATAGLILEGVLKPDRFVLTGGISNSVSITQEVIMLEPVITVQYEDGKNEFYVSGFVVINMRNEEIKVKGKISKHGSGFVALQIAYPGISNVFNNTFLQFRPLFGFALLWRRDDFECQIEIGHSHIGIGASNNDKVLRVFNSVGKIVPSDYRKNYLYGIIKDLTFQKVLDAFNLGTKAHEAPLLQEAKFVGMVKVIYLEADEGKKCDFLETNVSPGLTLSGDLKLSAELLKTEVKVDTVLGLIWTVEWPTLNMSKEIIQIKRNRDQQALGPMLTLTIPFNSKQGVSSTLKAFVTTVGIEQENVEIKIERKVDGFVYFSFTLKGKMFNEVEMVLGFKGSERNDDNFKMVGRCSSIVNIKKPIMNHLQKVFNSFVLTYNKEKAQNEKFTRNVDSLIHDIGSSFEYSVKGKLKDFIIQLEEVEEDIKEYLMGIDDDCIEKCSKKPVLIQALQEHDANDADMKNLQIQRITPKWAVNVSCIAVCEVDKGISYKKATERLSVARTLYPMYEKQKSRAQKLDKFLNVARKIEDIASKAKEYFYKHSEKARQVIETFQQGNLQSTWFEFHDLAIPEVDIGSLKGKLPCMRIKVKYTLYKETKEITEETCINGELFNNIAQNIFETQFTKSEEKTLLENFDKVKSFYARIQQRRHQLIELIQNGEHDEDLEAATFDKLSKRDKVFKPLVKQSKKEENTYDKKFKKLVFQTIPQYTVHSYKTSLITNQKSPWAILKAAKQQQSTAQARHSINTTISQGSDCGTINNVATKYSHLTNALTDLVEAYEDGKASFTMTRDDLVDSLHMLDSKITNEANRTYYTKGELKDMIYWSVRVWKGVEDWVQESTRQFEDHNRNAISLFTEQLDVALATERTSTAADYVQYLSHLVANAMKKMIIEATTPTLSIVKKTFGVPTSSITKRTFTYQQVDHVQNVALALSTFFRNKDMTLDEAATRLPTLRAEVRALQTKASTCDTTA